MLGGFIQCEHLSFFVAADFTNHDRAGIDANMDLELSFFSCGSLALALSYLGEEIFARMTHRLVIIDLTLSDYSCLQPVALSCP